MTTELTYLALAAGWTGILWIPYIVIHVIRNGPVKALSYRPDVPDPPWAIRLKKAHYNAIENLAPFAALVVVAHLAGVSNGMTTTGAALYFWARVAHPIGYLCLVPMTRTIPFAVGWVGIAMIFVAVLQAL